MPVGRFATARATNWHDSRRARARPRACPSYALHFAGWKKHIGLYPVPSLPEPLESEIASRRSGKDSLVFPHGEPLPVELISRIAREIAGMRGAVGES